jgi:E3 ubiquitin-protein ligase HERC1
MCVSTDLDTCEIDQDALLDLVSRFVLAALLRHCGCPAALEAFAAGAEPSLELAEFFLFVYQVRHKLWGMRLNDDLTECAEQEQSPEAAGA